MGNPFQHKPLVYIFTLISLWCRQSTYSRTLSSSIKQVSVRIFVTGPVKTGISAQITHVQKIVCFLVTIYNKSVL